MNRTEAATCPLDSLPSASLPVLALRAALMAEVRRFFDSRGYLEVDTPVLSQDIVVDAHLDPFVLRDDTAGLAREMFLQTSPEFHMKRLLAAGMNAIYQIARVLRRGEAGARHNPEFTMIEWYRAGDTHHEQMTCTEELVRAVFRRALLWRDENPQQAAHIPHPAEIVRSLAGERAPFERITYDEAFERFAGDRVLHKSPGELAAMARRLGIVPPPGLASDDRDGWLNLLLALVVEPHLGRERPVFLHDYPASQSALARVRSEAGRPPIAERFELYIAGIELCNGYHELTDADELRRRIDQQNALREREGLRLLPTHNRLLDAMDAGLPACAGVALGFDRLVMLSAGATAIADVIPFPWDRA